MVLRYRGGGGSSYVVYTRMLGSHAHQMKLHDATKALCGNIKLELHISLSITENRLADLPRSKHWNLVTKREGKRK